METAALCGVASNHVSLRLFRSTRAPEGSSPEPVVRRAIDALPEDRRERVRAAAKRVGRISLSDAVFTSGTKEEPPSRD